MRTHGKHLTRIALLFPLLAALACTSSDPGPRRTTDNTTDDDDTTATVAITLTAAAVTVDEDGSIDVTVTAEVKNSDDAPVFVVDAAPAEGTLSGNGPTWTYTPAADFHGSDSLQVHAEIGSVKSETITIDITVRPVNDAPAADGDSFSTDEDVPHAGTLAGSDVDGDALTFHVATGPAHGTLALASAGSFTYTPDADYNGADSFTFTTRDGTVHSAAATVSITVDAVNDAPVVWPRPIAVFEAKTYAGTVTASDAEGDAVTWESAVLPGGGTVTWVDAAAGTFTFTPAAGFAGAATFAVRATDDQALASAWTVVTVEVYARQLLGASPWGACAIDNLGAAACWGYGPPGPQSANPATTAVREGTLATDWTFVATSGQHGCLINDAFELHCWGGNWSGQLGPASVNAWEDQPVFVGAGWAAVVAPADYTCGIDVAGVLWCWGSAQSGRLGLGDVDGQTFATPQHVDSAGDGWRSISGSTSNMCGVKRDGTLWCWGSNGGYLLGFGGDSNIPLRIGADSDWSTVANSGSTACAVKTGGTLWCWGYNTEGTLGYDPASFPIEYAPKLVGLATNWADVAVSGGHTCAIDTSGAISCFGANGQGQLGVANGPGTYLPQPVGGTYSGVGVMSSSSCARDMAGAAWCWGDNSGGVLGAGATPDHSTPAPVNSSLWSGFSAGQGHNCGLQGGTLWCWGDNSYGQLGDGGTIARSVPLQTGTGTGWTAVETGSGVTCGLQAGEIWCAGYNNYGTVGNSASPWYSSPDFLREETNSLWTDLSLTRYLACAVRADTSLWCWGYNNYAGAGTTPSLRVLVPTQVGTGTGWLRAAAGHEHACGIKTDGTLWCWGRNDQGQLGIGATSPDDCFGMACAKSPQQAGSATDWVEVTAGSAMTCGIRDTAGARTLWCWGAGYLWGSTSSNVPLQEPGGGVNWALVRASPGGHQCAVGTDGALWCWGYNGSGELGTGDKTARAQLTQVGSDTDWADVSVNYSHSCATKTDQTLHCWGAGNLGDGKAWTETPRAVVWP